MDPFTLASFGANSAPSLSGGDSIAKGQNVVTAATGDFIVGHKQDSNIPIIAIVAVFLGVLVFFK